MAYQRYVAPPETLTCTAVALTEDDRVWFRPRILRDVSSVDWSTTILGQKSSLPLYIVRLTTGTLPWWRWNISSPIAP